MLHKMREHKYRVWDIKERAMHQAGFLIDSDGAIYDNTLCDGEIQSYSFGSGKLILMEYTGLKDKNTTEIFRGDILRNDNYPEAEDAEVVWFEGAFRVKGLSPDADIEEYLSEVNEVTRVIGTIFEKQEFAEDKE